MTEDELRALTKDIKANGLIDNIILTQDGQLLDGRNRLIACERLGIEPRVDIYSGTDLVAFSISKNLSRRHLSRQELELIGAGLANLELGSNQFKRKEGPSYEGPSSKQGEVRRSEKQVAKQLGVSVAGIQDARSLRRSASPNVIDFVKTGKVSSRAGAAFARHTPKEEQEKATADEIKKKGQAICKKSPTKAKTPKQPKRASPPFVWASNLPTGDDLKGLNPNQRVHLHAFSVKQMLDAESTTKAMMNAVIVAASPAQLEAETFFEAIDKMLAWIPQQGATDGKQWNFAKRADTILEQIEPALYKALERIQNYIAALEARQKSRAIKTHA
jgi:ParB-like chromosome segregation protein Spo0J